MPGKSMLVVMGLCMGLILFGINIVMINFNRLVVPEQPLSLFDWRAVEEELEITLLGETLYLSLDNPWPGDLSPESIWPGNLGPEEIIERARECYFIGRDEISRRLVPVWQRVREVMDWP